ncbi:MAG: hypothetical protein J3R72DRAFT_102220 [Linnemannia gamsii]|nr:MAG: hypothetical protein J3R72DRAFT_102220 [Linnemannia gamsii]
MERTPPDKDNRNEEQGRRTRRMSPLKSPEPVIRSAMMTLPAASATLVPSDKETTIKTGDASGAHKIFAARKKKRVRKPVVKTTPQYMTESDPESEVQQRPVQQQNKKLAKNRTTLLDDRPKDSPSLSPPGSPLVVLPPGSSMLRPKSTTSTISSSPASSSRMVKQSQIFQPPTLGVKKYTSRRRLQLEEEDGDDNELELELDAEMETVGGLGKAARTVENPQADKHSSVRSPKKKQPVKRANKDRDVVGMKEKELAKKTTRRLSKGKTPLTQTIAIAPPGQEDPIFLDEVRTTVQQPRKNKAPQQSHAAKQDQEVQQQTHPESETEQRVDYNLIAAGTFKIPKKRPRKGGKVVEEIYQQHFRFHERNAYRMVDYLHTYDWMSPVAPMRAANNAIQQKIDQLSKKIDLVIFANQTLDLCCTECAGKELNSDNPEDPRCSKCERVMFDTVTEQVRLQGRNESINEEILKLRSGRHWLPPTPLYFDCNWCGSKSRSLKSSTVLEEQSVDTKVYIKGIGSLPSYYGFDHDFKRLCKYCSYKCSKLLLQKRRFQLLYELSASIQPLGCVNCGIRESARFRPDIGHIGLLCSVCSDFKERKGVDPEIPQVHMRIEELQTSIVNHSIDGVIRWDRIANDPRANPNFEFSAHGLLHRFVQHQTKPDQPRVSTYILLQQNHLTRKNERSQLYTCQARTPTQAALYFSRFVALYKKQPMTYLYVRKLEAWNIPTPRLDDWEDKTSGLQTFEELKQRVRDSVLNSVSLTQVEIQQLYEALFPINPEQTLKRIPSGTDDVWKTRLAELIGATIGPENQHLLQQLHFDDEAWNQYLVEWLAPRSHFKAEIRKQKAQAGGDVEDDASTLQEEKDMDTEIEGFDITSDVMIKEKYGLVRSSTGLGLVPLDPPEPRFKQLPKWAQERASQVHRQAIQDERLNHLHERHLFYESVVSRQPKAVLPKDLRLGVEHVHQNQKVLLRARIMREEKERVFGPNDGRRVALPSPHDPTPMPSAMVPTHLVPSECQVHVYQAILTAEARTVDVRLVRTERYKRQGDCLAGGGPIQIPKIIDRKALRGFYREADRAERYGSALSGESLRAGEDRMTIVLRADKNNGKARAEGERSGDGFTGLSGVETWNEVEEETMIEMGISDAVLNRTNGHKRLQSSLEYAEFLGRKPEVLKERRKEFRRITGLSRRDVQIVDRRLYTVNREVSNAAGDAQAARMMVVAAEKEKEKEREVELSEEIPEDSRVSKKEVTEIVEGRVVNEMAAKSGLRAGDSLRRLESAKIGTDKSSSSSSAEELLDRIRRERKRFMDIAHDVDMVLKYKKRKQQEQDNVEWIVREVEGDREEVEGLLRIATAAVGEFDASASANRTVAPAESQGQDEDTEQEGTETDVETDDDEEDSRME